ncbi:MAG TPA: HYR domain-containing protein [Blastocatellia bacterium]|nr:HYR domain-containing protein [Blastocatellia bacterium]
MRRKSAPRHSADINPARRPGDRWVSLRRPSVRLLAVPVFVAFVAAVFFSRPAATSVGDFLVARLAAKAPAARAAHGTAPVKQQTAPARIDTDAGDSILGMAELRFERRGHTATLLANGKVILIGGENADGLVKKAEVFDAASRRLAASAKLLEARAGHTATRLADGRILVIGGRGENGALAATEIYDPATERFTPGAALNRARVGHSATALADGRILVVGGDSEGSAELYDAATASFTLIEQRLSAPRAFHAAALLRNGKVLIVGGLSEATGGVETAELFDTAAMRFSAAVNPMHSGRVRPTLRVLPDGKVQVIGGDDERSMEMFNPDGEYFTAFAHLLGEREALTKILRTQTRAAFIREVGVRAESVAPDRLGEALDRSDYSLTEIPEAHQALLAGGKNSGGQTLKSFVLMSSSTASVTTDKTDYAPGETVTITGSGWQAGETVSLVLHRETSEHPDTRLSATADEDGNFTNQEFAPDQDDFGVTLTLTATGQASGYTAQTTFTDAGPPNAQITVTTNIACAQGGTFQITRVQQNGNTLTSGGTTPQTFGGLAPNSPYTITNIQATVNGTTYTGPATITGTTGAAGSTTTVTLTYQDNTPPTITCPASITRSNDTNQCGAVVNYPAPTASDNCAGLGAITCTPASGSFYSVGTTSVTCTVRDAANNPASCTFTVTVNDTQAPTITCPADITQSTDTGNCSAVVNYAAPTVSDNCPGVGAATCTPASGSVFAKGTTQVTCNVTDAAGNTGSCSFNVTVKDTEPPTITCPAAVTQSTDAGQCSAVVNYPAPTASDNCSGVTVSCSPASGSTFNKGTTPVNCTATDTSGNTASCSFAVTVVDTEKPTILCPANQTAFQDSAFGATVNYPPPTVSDNCPGVVAQCVPPSGSVFPLGATPVNCTATDTSGNTATCSFTVTVVPPPSTAGDKVTGGGSIFANGGKATFGLTAMASSPTTPQGNVTYQSHLGMTVKSTVITAVVVTGTHARIFGKATINNAGSFDFVVDVDDLGEPGTSDTFAIQISNGYTAGGVLTGGNIQLH